MKAIKWAVIGIFGLLVIIIAALLIVPMFIDVQKYKPEIEKQVAEATGRPFAIGGELKLSLFPWAGLAFSDLHLGNPPGFKEKDMLFVKSFDVQVKLMPLLSKDIQVKRFVIEGPRVALEKKKDGKANWEGLGKPSAKTPTPTKQEEKGKPPAKGSLGELPIKSLVVGEMAIRNGNVLWIDGTTGDRKEIKDLGLELKDVSLDRPIRLLLSASLDGKPLQVEGNVGPLGKELGMGSIPLEVSVKALKEISLSLKGQIANVIVQPRFDLALDLAPFSPRKVMSALGQAFPLTTSDPNALDRVSLKCKVKGDTKSVALSDGVMDLDQSKIVFSAAAKDFTKPDLAFKMNIDQLDVDKYLPPPAEKKPSGEKAAPPPPEKKTDYAPLRKMVLDGEIRVGKVKAMGAHAQDVLMKVRARGGVIHVDPFGLKAYEGTLTIKEVVDVRTDTPKTSLDLETAGMKVRPLLNDVMKKDILDGKTQAKMTLKMEGDEAEAIKRTLNGSGDLRFTDGAIIGIDLPGMVRNVKASFGLGEKPTEKPKTDFSELAVPFTIKDGLFHTPGTSMASPLLRLQAAGQADLVKETLDFRVEPKVVATLKGQADTKERSGLLVPVLVTGTFSSPSFAPDLKGMFEQKLKEGMTSPEGLKDMLKGGGTKEGAAPTTQKDTAKDLLKGLPFKR
ncbi:MAG: AsmA family protein [Deltaproteobacteria bacterium]|nr:AsmA family protein [Deltaproteobacteria bacterium]